MLVATPPPPPPLFTTFTSNVYEQELDLSAYLHADVLAHDASSSSSPTTASNLAPSTVDLFSPIQWPPRAPAPVFRTIPEAGAGTVDPSLLCATSASVADFSCGRAVAEPYSCSMSFHPLPSASPASEYFPDLDSDDGSHPSPRSVVPVNVGMRGTARKVTVASGGIVKRYAHAPMPGSSSRKENTGATPFPTSSSTGRRQPPPASSLPNDDDDELPTEWRPSPEDLAKLSSKEKRQLRNKISARNFRVRRKEYISNLEEALAQRDALVDSVSAQLTTAQKETRALRAEIVALKQKLLDRALPPATPLSMTPSFPSSSSSPAARISIDPSRIWNAAPASTGCFTNVHTARIPDICLPCKPSSLDCLSPFAGSWTMRLGSESLTSSPLTSAFSAPSLAGKHPGYGAASALPAVSIRDAACAALAAQALLRLLSGGASAYPA
ncbi:BZIP domain-containing protein [Mycena kentingensis (nom. inval.)]|nr:BZIP domain-containing protein [Mycena kentingensis (nom. inval.)]